MIHRFIPFFSDTKFRKDFLTKYLDRLLSGPYDEK
jgi:hypothetical protein